MPLICFASPKGGVGKTTLAANLAGALHRLGRRVIALDCDPQNSLRLHFGIPLAETGGFCAELPRRPDWRAALRETPSGIGVLPHGLLDLRGALGLAAALDRDPDLLATPLRAMLADPELVVIADTAPGPSQALAAMAPLSTVLVAVLQAEATSAALAPEVESGRFLGSGPLATLLSGRIRVLLNGIDMRSRLSRASAEAVARHLGPRLLGSVSRDEMLAEALACQRLVLDIAPDSRAATDLRVVARALDQFLPPAAPPALAVPAPVNASGWGAA